MLTLVLLTCVFSPFLLQSKRSRLRLRQGAEGVQSTAHAILQFWTTAYPIYILLRLLAA